MAARFVYWMNVSLDLRIEREDGEHGGGDWMRIGETLHREFNARAERMSQFVEGRIVYDIMASFWPAARDDTDLEDVLREYGAIWTDKPKILVSNTRTRAEHNTRIVGGDAIAELAALRESGDGDIGVGGATLATALLQAGLLDELLLFTHPVVLGTGRPLFDRIETPLQLDLLETQPFPRGVVMNRYAVRDAR